MASSSVSSRSAAIFGCRNSALSSKSILASRQISFVLGDDQRIDLEQAHVLGDEGLVELGEQRPRLLRQVGVELQRLRHVAHVMRHDAGRRIDREGHDLVRRVVRDLFDVHAAFGRDDEGDARGLAVDQRRQVEFAVDRRAFLDVEPVDLLAVRPGLMRDQRRAEEPRRFLLHVVDRFDDLDAAGLAAAAGMDLRLHHPDRPAELVGGLHRFIDAECRNAARHRHAEVAQHRFGLVFVDVHSRPHRLSLSAKADNPVNTRHSSITRQYDNSVCGDYWMLRFRGA